MNLSKNIYLSRVFFGLYFGAILLFVIATSYDWMLIVAQSVLLILFGLTVLDVLLTFGTKNPIVFKRIVQERLNLGDPNSVVISIENTTGQPIGYRLYEGYPVIMQERSKAFVGIVGPNGKREYSYTFVPKERGEYEFRDVFVLMSSVFNLISRRIDIPAKQTIQV